VPRPAFVSARVRRSQQGRRGCLCPTPVAIARRDRAETVTARQRRGHAAGADLVAHARRAATCSELREPGLRMDQFVPKDAATCVMPWRS
jgi:hypothetical protein